MSHTLSTRSIGFIHMAGVRAELVSMSLSAGGQWSDEQWIQIVRQSIHLLRIAAPRLFAQFKSEIRTLVLHEAETSIAGISINLSEVMRLKGLYSDLPYSAIVAGLIVGELASNQKARLKRILGSRNFERIAALSSEDLSPSHECLNFYARVRAATKWQHDPINTKPVPAATVRIARPSNSFRGAL